MVFSQKLNSHRIFKRLAKALIRLRVCAGWSEALLVAHTTLLEIPCCSSNDLKDIYFFEVLFVFVALRPMSTAMVIAGRSVHLTTLFPGQACASG